MKLFRTVRLARLVLLAVAFTSSFVAAQTASVKHNSNLRESASSSSAIVRLLPAGTGLTLVSNQLRMGYYHARTGEGETGWLWGRNIDVSPSSTATTLSTASTHSLVPGNLLAVLHGAQVAAVPQPLVIGGHTVCEATGNATDPKKKALNSQKNRIDIPAQNAYIPVDWDVLKDLASNAPNSLQGAPISLIGYLSHQIKVQTGGSGESTNCHLLQADEVDWHVYVTKSPNQPISKAIIVETTPRTRPLHQWNKTDLDNLVNKNTRVRISGWLMYDWEHIGVIGTQRVNVWEVHPITRIEVENGNGWKDIEHP